MGVGWMAFVPEDAPNSSPSLLPVDVVHGGGGLLYHTVILLVKMMFEGLFSCKNLMNPMMVLL